VSAEDAENYKSFEARLQQQMANYLDTVTTDEDKAEFAAFEKS
jgi:methyl-accepting chemotaxis protein WspA